MKTLENTTNKNLVTSIFVVIIILLSGCKKNTLLAPVIQENNIENSVSVNLQKYYKVVDLMAGEHLYKVGKVEITDHNTGTVEIKYTVDEPWKIHSLRLFFGSPNSLPLNSIGECIADKFPHKLILSAGGSITSATILLPKSALPNTGIVSANAKIINQKTLSVPEDAWAYGQKVCASDMAMYFNYNLIFVSTAVPIDPIKKI